MIRVLKKRVGRIAIGIVATVVVLSIVLTFVPFGEQGMRITTGGYLSFDARVLMAAQAGNLVNGNNESVNLTPQASPVTTKSLLAIQRVSYENGLEVDFADSLPDIYVPWQQLQQLAGNKAAPAAEIAIENYVQNYIELWIDLSDYPVDDPWLQVPPNTRHNERVEQVLGKNWCVVTLGYFDIHIYNLELDSPDDFITRFSNSPIEEGWWQ